MPKASRRLCQWSAKPGWQKEPESEATMPKAARRWRRWEQIAQKEGTQITQIAQIFFAIVISNSLILDRRVQDSLTTDMTDWTEDQPARQIAFSYCRWQHAYCFLRNDCCSWLIGVCRDGAGNPDFKYVLHIKCFYWFPIVKIRELSGIAMIVIRFFVFVLIVPYL